MVWLTFAFEPWTVTLPAFVGRDARVWDRSLKLSCKVDGTKSDQFLVLILSPNTAHLYPVIQLQFTTSVYADTFEGFSRKIVRLSA